MKRRLVSYYKGDGIFWFRILGKGLHFRDPARHQLLFSERNGYAKGVYIKRLG